MLLANNIEPSALPDGMVPVYIDVTPMDNSNPSKQGISRTYNDFYGYVPMMSSHITSHLNSLLWD